MKKFDCSPASSEACHKGEGDVTWVVMMRYIPAKIVIEVLEHERIASLRRGIAMDEL